MLVLPRVRHIASLLAGGLVWGFALSISATARAADAETERARALFDEAGELERLGQWSAAQEKLRAALRRRDTPQLHYALGWALENDDKLLEAKIAYEHATRTGSAVPGGGEAARLGAARLAELEKKTPVIKVRVGDGRGHVRVLVDGRKVKREDGTDTAAMAVNPGSHVLRIERGPDDAIERMVYVGRGAARTIDVDVDPAAAARRAQAKTPTSPRSNGARARGALPARGRDRVLPILLASGGVAFVAAGGALFLSSPSDADTGDTTRALGLALGSVGIVAGTVGTVLLLVDDDAPSAKTSASRARACITPLAGGVFASTAFAF